MNDKKLNALFRSARNESPPEPGPEFEGLVMRAISRALQYGWGERAGEPLSIFDQLALLFPRIAIGATAVICLCFLGDLFLTTIVQPDFSTSIAELSQQWLFAAN